MAESRLNWIEKDGGWEACSMFGGKSQTFFIKPPKKRRTWFALEHPSLKIPQRHETLTGAKDAAQLIAEQGKR